VPPFFRNHALKLSTAAASLSKGYTLKFFAPPHFCVSLYLFP
jgi:predicted deacetylase